jgi:hypothetical protein
MKSIGDYRGEEEFACLSQFSGLQKIKIMDADPRAEHIEDHVPDVEGDCGCVTETGTGRWHFHTDPLGRSGHELLSARSGQGGWRKRIRGR